MLVTTTHAHARSHTQACAHNIWSSLQVIFSWMTTSVGTGFYGMSLKYEHDTANSWLIHLKLVIDANILEIFQSSSSLFVLNYYIL